MGCSCNNEFKRTENNIAILKEDYQKEYHSYLDFIYKLKTYLNTSQTGDKNYGEENNDNNAITKKEFYLIPSKWFEEWEIWIKNIITKNEFKTFNTKFKYRNFKNKEKFYFHLITEENWMKIYKNKIYNFGEEFKTKLGIICNNLIILKYGSSDGENKDIEIFFFEKDEDLFLTNLLFSFEKCEDSNYECNNLFSILKSSPIYEILGNMYYDKSKSEFIESIKKIKIYNKTRTISEDIKQFRKSQYQLFSGSRVNYYKPDSEKEKFNNNEILIDSTNEQNSKFIKIGGTKNESQMLSRASTIMNHQNLANNNSMNIGNRIRIKKQNDIFTDEQEGNNTNEGINSKINDKLLINNKLKKNLTKKIGFNNQNELEITEIVENKINESLLFSVIFCFFAITQIREFIQKQKDIQIEDNIYLTFSNIMNYLFDKLCSQNNSFDINKIKNIDYNLIKNCPEYNYQKLVEIIKGQPGKNLISRIINLLHNNINNKIPNYSSSKNFFKNLNESNPKYTDFINSILPIHNSIFFDLFFGIKKVAKRCTKCKNEFDSYKLMNIINISIDKIKKHQKKNKIESKELSIEEYLDLILNKESDSKFLFKCTYCNNNISCNKIKNICAYPDIVVFYIFYDNQEDIKINFNANITFLNEKYALIGIISQKINFNEKKYVSYCQDVIDKKWFKFDENKINEIDFNKEKNDISYPEALFYQKKNNA